MQQEDLLKRIRLFATMTTVAFVVLIVTLLIQFGFIAYYHTQLSDLEKNNAQIQEEIVEIQKEIAYQNNQASKNEND